MTAVPAPALHLGPIPQARIVVLVSGTGSLLESLIAHLDDHPAQIVAVLADRPCRGLDIAAAAGITTQCVPPVDYADREHWDAALRDAVAAHQPELVVSAGFMRILGAAFLGHFEGRVINTHPALLPAFPGAHAVADALAYGVKVTGCTVHLVDAGVDTGPIIAQAALPVHTDDTVATLHERIKTVERQLLCEVIDTIHQSGVVIPGKRSTDSQ